MEYKTLNNGVKMPVLGYGVYQVPPAQCERCVSDAISVGYRSIDTAQIYQNEEGVGNALRKSGIARDQFFLTTKVWLSNGGYKKAKTSIDESLKKLQTDYIDLLLIHQPFNDYYGTYHAMEDACKEGKLRAIGVSNFYPDRLVDLNHFVTIKPAVNQIETHIFQQQQAAHAIMDKCGIQHESWGPLAEGRNGFFNNSTLKEIGAKYNKSIAQTALRFLIQSNIVVIPKSTHKERMIENLDVFDFKLNDEEIKQIRTLDKKETVFFSHYDPATVESIINISM